MGKIARFGRHRRKEKGDSAFERKMEAFRTASHRFSCGTGEAGETALAVMEAVRETAGGKEPEAADTFPARYRDFYAFRPEGCLERTAYAAGRMLLLLPSIFRAEGEDAVEAALDFCELLHRELEPAMNMEMEREGGGSCWFPGGRLTARTVWNPVFRRPLKRQRGRWMRMKGGNASPGCSSLRHTFWK